LRQAARNQAGDMVLRLAEALEIPLRAGKWLVVRSAGAVAKSGNES
jgi:hypothetical protein